MLRVALQETTMKILVATDGSKAARRLFDSAGVRRNMEVRTCHVAQEIGRRAKAGKFDLIALGEKGCGTNADLLLGSVAQRVLTMADMPVVLVK